MKLFGLTALIATAILIFSCVNSAKNEDMKVEELASKIQQSPLPPAEDYKPEGEYQFQPDSTGRQQDPRQEDERKKQQRTPEQAKAPDWDKKIIKTASVNVEVKEYNSFYTSLREKVKNLGGYIAQEEQSQSEYKIENSMVIKVPVDQFDNAVVQLTANVEKTNEKKITSQDVTTEVVDTKSRMEAKKQVRQRYMDLLGQAKNMQEILSVQSEINGIQEEIESATGRIQYLTHSSAFSTISLTYYQVLNSLAKDTGKPSFGKKLIAGFKTGWEITSELFIGIVTIWPLLLTILLGVFVYKKIRVQKSRPV